MQLPSHIRTSLTNEGQARVLPQLRLQRGCAGRYDVNSVLLIPGYVVASSFDRAYYMSLIRVRARTIVVQLVFWSSRY